MSKVPDVHKFFDFSDYARPFGDGLVRYLQHTAVTPLHVTWLFVAAGLAAAYLYWLDRPAASVLAGLLLLLKSGLDAADGALARAKNRPSKVGRFFDSIADFAVNVVVVAAIGSTLVLSSTDEIIFVVVVLLSMTWQGSIYNYFYVSYRWQHQGDMTSSTDESKLDAALYPWDNRYVLIVLHRLYLIIYAWQDRLIAVCERLVAGENPRPVGKGFMTATSVLGLGTQLLIICLLSLIDKPQWSLYAFAGPFNVYWIILLIWRKPDSKTRS